MACMRWTQSRLSSSCDEFQGIRRNFIKGTAAPFLIPLYTALDYVYIVLLCICHCMQTPRAYCANTDDLAPLISHLQSSWPSVPIVGLGVSMGG